MNIKQEQKQNTDWTSNQGRITSITYKDYSREEKSAWNKWGPNLTEMV